MTNRLFQKLNIKTPKEISKPIKNRTSIVATSQLNNSYE